MKEGGNLNSNFNHFFVIPDKDRGFILYFMWFLRKLRQKRFLNRESLEECSLDPSLDVRRTRKFRWINGFMDKSVVMISTKNKNHLFFTQRIIRLHILKPKCLHHNKNLDNSQDKKRWSHAWADLGASCMACHQVCGCISSSVECFYRPAVVSPGQSGSHIVTNTQAPAPDKMARRLQPRQSLWDSPCL